jgi:hypothetical protein
MNSAQDFLLAAKRCEIHALEQLSLTCELVKDVSGLIHVLQRERGASNVYLGSRGSRFQHLLSQHIAGSKAAEVEVRRRFVKLDQNNGRVVGGVRLFSRIAYVLHGLESLPDLRVRIQELELSSLDATSAFSRLIGGLLAIVFEAADTSADPEITKILVALFNFMQGKEFAGQERAVGATGFAAGYFSLLEQQKILHVIDAQERSFEIFTQFATPETLAAWQKTLSSTAVLELKRLRQLVQKASPEHPVPSELSELWFELTTRRIDEMQWIEQQLAATLVAISDQKINEAQSDLRSHKDILDALVAMDAQTLSTVTLLFNAGSVMPESSAQARESVSLAGMSPAFSRSVFELVQAQAQRLQAVSDQLCAAKQALQERKQIERAKGLLMLHRSLSEEQAYKMLRQAAMEQNRRLIDVAETVVSMVDLLQDNRGKSPTSLRV